MRPFRFAVSLRTGSISSSAQLTDTARRAEELGYDAVHVADHLDGISPFPALVAIAAATSRVRVATLTLNAAFSNPALLAREVETTVWATGGRLELGLGTGYMKSEFDEAGLAWLSASERVDHLERIVAELRKRLAPDDLPPLLVAAKGDRMLRIAAREADIAAFSGLRQIPGAPPGWLDLDNADELAARLDAFDRYAGARSHEIERHLLIQHVAVTGEPRQAVQHWRDSATRSGQSRLSVDELVAAPQIVVGSVPQICERLQDVRRRYGFSYFSVFSPYLEEFAPVVAAMSGR